MPYVILVWGTLISSITWLARNGKPTKHHHHHHSCKYCADRDSREARQHKHRQENADKTASMAYRMPHDRDRTVYIILHQDGMIATILGVYEELQDANRDCLFQASQGGIDLMQDSPTNGPDKYHFSPIEPARWDTPDGVSCWVESHTVEPSRVVGAGIEARGGTG